MNEWDGVKAFAKTLALITTITVGVAAGNLLSNYIMLRGLANAFESSFSEPIRNIQTTTVQRPITNQQPRPTLQTPSQAVEQISRETRRQREISDQLNRTCNFWISEYNKTRKAADKAHRDVACRDAGRPFN